MSQNPGSARIAAEVAATDAVVEAIDHEADPQPAAAPVSRDEGRRRVLRARAALIVMALVVLVVVLLLPIAATSLLNQLRTTNVVPAYNGLTGEPLDPQRLELAPVDATYANFDISDIDETTRAATIIGSGNRACHHRPRLLFLAKEDRSPPP
jgi:hypothetical protein